MRFGSSISRAILRRLNAFCGSAGRMRQSRSCIDGTAVRFRKMRDGADGRPTHGLRPADAVSKGFWDAMQLSPRREGSRWRWRTRRGLRMHTSLRSVTLLRSGTARKTRKPMIAYERWDIVTALFPFTDAPVRKPRPVLVPSHRQFQSAIHAHVIGCMITTGAGSQWPSDHVIAELYPAGLAHASVVRWKLFTLPVDLLGRRIGALSDFDRARSGGGSRRDPSDEPRNPIFPLTASAR